MAAHGSLPGDVEPGDAKMRSQRRTAASGGAEECTNFSNRPKYVSASLTIQAYYGMVLRQLLDAG